MKEHINTQRGRREEKLFFTKKKANKERRNDNEGITPLQPPVNDSFRQGGQWLRGPLGKRLLRNRISAD